MKEIFLIFILIIFTKLFSNSIIEAKKRYNKDYDDVPIRVIACILIVGEIIAIIYIFITLFFNI